MARRRHKTEEQIYEQADRLNEANWRRRNTWSDERTSYRAKMSRERLIGRAERNTLKQRGFGLANG